MSEALGYRISRGDAMKLLIINPNTTEKITETITARARAVAAGGCEIMGVTAPLGAAYISRPNMGRRPKRPCFN